jgi:hypothetical protein
MENIYLSLVKIAEYLDNEGFYHESDKLTRIAQYAGPQNLNLPLESRVIPFGEMEEEFRDVARKRREYNPRLQPKEHEGDDAGDMMDINGPQGLTEEDVEEQHHKRQHHKHHHYKHHHHDDTENIEEDFGNDNEEDTIFNINRDDQHEGASITSLNGDPVGGIAQRIYDPKGAGYMGLDHFQWDNFRNDNNKGYSHYSAN